MRHLIRVALLLFVSLLLTRADAGEPPKSEPVVLAEQVHRIFEAKCVDCHGPDMPRPKGKFGYVLDLARVAENPDYVVKGDAEASEIYNMVLHNEMPGEDANVPPLTPEEVDIVKRWINAGAPGQPPATEVAPAQPQTPVAVQQPARPADPLWKMSLRWVGKLHPVSTHFPVGLMFAAVLAELLGWATRRDSWLQTVRFLVVVAALGGLATSTLGWVNAYFSSYDKAPGALLWWHRWLGTGTAVWAVICAASAFMGECREGSYERNRFRVALLVGATLVGISGFLGSALIYGLDHYAWQ